MIVAQFATECGTFGFDNLDMAWAFLDLVITGAKDAWIATVTDLAPSMLDKAQDIAACLASHHA